MSQMLEINRKGQQVPEYAASTFICLSARTECPQPRSSNMLKLRCSKKQRQATVCHLVRPELPLSLPGFEGAAHSW